MKRKIFSVILAGALTLGLTVSASAATVTTGVTQDDGEITVSGAVSGAAAGQQVTILVVKDGTDLDELTSADVAYIDQVSATSNYSVSFQMPTTMSSGKFDVYVGGTEVTTLATTEFVIAGTHTLSGSGITTSANGADLTKVWVCAYTAGTDVLVEKSNANEDGTFSMFIPAGMYDIKVGRDGYLTKVYSNVSIDSDNSSTVLGLQLLAGDVNADNFINIYDLNSLFNSYNKQGNEFNQQADFNDDGFVALVDLNSLINNYMKGY